MPDEMKSELRFGTFETREADTGLGLVGYAAVFDSPTIIGGAFREVIRRGAFRDYTIDADLDVRALHNHNSAAVIGRRSAGTLRMEEDDRGLRVEIDLPDNTLGRDLMVSIRRRDVREMSFEFFAKDERWSRGDDDNDLPTRELLAVKVPEVSIVTFPAYADTEIAKRSAELAMASCPFADKTPDEVVAASRRARAALRLALQRRG